MRKSRLRAQNMDEVDRANVLKSYVDGMDCQEAATRWDVSPMFVHRLVKSAGKLRPKGYGRGKLSPNQKVALVTDYKSGMTCEQLASKYGLRVRASVWELLKTRGLLVPKQERQHRRYTLDHEAFSDHSEANAYWLGFLITDGCLHRAAGGTYRLVLQLSAVDVEHVRKFASHLRSTSPVHVRDSPSLAGRRMACFCAIIRRKSAERLIAQGVTERKTHTAMASEAMAGNRHFWRGAVDGDGSLFYYLNHRNKRPVAALSFVSASWSFMDQFCRFTHGVIGGSPISAHWNRGVWGARLCAKRARDLAHVLYEGASISLDRKMEIATTMLGYNSLRRDPHACN